MVGTRMDRCIANPFSGILVSRLHRPRNGRSIPSVLMDSIGGMLMKTSVLRVFFMMMPSPRALTYVLGGRYNIDNNEIEIAIRPLALGRKNYLFVGIHDAAVRAAIVYSLFSCCKASKKDTRIWKEDILRRIPTENNLETVSIRATAYCSRERSWLHLQKVHEICLQENRF